MNRREFLHSAGTIVFGLFAGHSDTSLDYEDTEAELRKIADELDDHDISTVEGSFDAFNAINLSRARQGLDSNSTDVGVRIARLIHRSDELLTILPWVSDPPDQPELVTEIETMEKAMEYYSTLEGYLNQSIDFYDELDAVEREMLSNDDAPPTVNRSQLETIESELEDLQSRTHEMPSNPFFTELTPDIDEKLSEARQLKQGYRAYADAQVSTVTVQDAIVGGAMERENENVGAAKQAFEDAESVSFNPSSTVSDFAIAEDGLAVRDYEEMLSQYRRGAELMRESCENIGHSSSRTVFGEGLEHLFAARGLLENSIHQ